MRTTEKSYRPEIDGLRAVAVVSVLLFHLGLPAFSGGYAGVDVFFVISGYLITKNIHREIGAGTFTFRNFYLGRFRRLFPALLTTIAVTLLVGALLFAPTHLTKLAQSAVWSILPFSNYYFWTEAGYWDLGSILKPLLHIWSLSVEEQFYFVWPMLVFAFVRWRRSLPIVILLILFIAGSNCASIYYGVGRPLGFYWTTSRAFEFLIGAALIPVERYRAPRPALELLAVAGIFLIGWAVLTYDSTTAFPWDGAIYPCIGAALLIYVGSKPVISGFWNNRPMIWIGKFSYSLYLVHWPVIVFYAYWRGAALNGYEQAGVAATSIGLAFLLHHFVAQPLRYASVRLLPIGALTAATLLISGLAWHGQGWRWRHPAPIAEGMLPCEGGFGLCPGAAGVALIGDSHANQSVLMIAGILKKAGLSGTLYPAENNCALMRDAFPVKSLAKIPTDKCRAAQKLWRERIISENPAAVILASFWLPGISEDHEILEGRLVGSDTVRMPTLTESRARFASQMKETIDWLTSDGRKVVILGTSPYVEIPPSICYDRPEIFSRPDCSRNVMLEVETQAFVTNFFRTVSGGRSNVQYIDLTELLCKDGYCPLGENGISFYHDSHHLNYFGERWLMDRMGDKVTAFLRSGIAKPLSGSNSTQ